MKERETTLKERFQSRVAELRTTQAEVARRMGVPNPQNITKWFERDNIPIAWRQKAAKALQCNEDWLVMGRGEKEISIKYRPTRLPAYDIKDWSDEEELESREVLINVSDIHLAAGAGAQAPEFVETKMRLSFDRNWLLRKGLDVDRVKLVPVKGDSMRTTLNDGDVVLVNLDRTEVIDGKIYALVVGMDLKVKRLRKKYDGSLVLTSDNQSGDYPDEVIPPDHCEHVHIVGLVVYRSGDVS